MPPTGIFLIEQWPGVYRLEAPWAYARQGGLNDWIKTQDGEKLRYHFDMDSKLYRKKCWYLPKERLPALQAFATARSWPLVIEEREATYPACPVLDMWASGTGPNAIAPLTPWQKEGLSRLLGDRVLLAQWITGSGKSRLALEAHKCLHQGSKTLIVAPKVVLRTWEQEQISRWAPDATTWTYTQGRALTLKKGRGNSAKDVTRPQADITLVSWGSLHKVLELVRLGWKFDFLVFDELHAGIHSSSKRSKEAAQLSTLFPDALRLGLTATPTSASLTDLHSQLNILCPHRWGTYKRWWQYYFHKESVGWEDHVKPGALREDRLPELISELETICHYVGQEDVGDALPPVNWNQLDIGHECATRLTPPANIRQWRQEQLRTYQTRSAAFTYAWEKGTLAPGHDPSKPTAIVVYHRAVAQELAQSLPGATLVTGEIPPKQRHAILTEATTAIMTMRSVTEGLDLRRYTQVYVLEAYPVPLYLTQVLGRFVRLFAKDAVSVTVCRLRGSSDDVVTHKLLTRMSERRKLLTEGKTEEGLAALLGTDENSEEFLTELRAACAELEEPETDDWDDGSDWE